MSTRPEVLILYGSQTGCAQDSAESLERALIRLRFVTSCVAMDDADWYSLPSASIVLFICSTCGQGEMPDNMKLFWRFLLRKDLPSDSLSSTACSVFGLGDSSYPLYNAAARKLYQRLLQLGADMIVPRALGDDQADMGPDEALEPWIKAVSTALLQRWPLPENIQPLSDLEPLPPKFSIRISTASNNTPPAAPLRPYGSGERAYQPTPARLAANMLLTGEGHVTEVRHLVLEVPEVVYDPGDVVAIHPCVPDEQVKLMLELCGLTSDSIIDVDPPHHDSKSQQQMGEQGAGHLYLPGRLTALDLFSTHLDVAGCPGRSFFSFLAVHAKNETEQARALEFASAAGMRDYWRYCVKERRTYAEVLSEFPSAKPPLVQLISILPRVSPRLFSIASAPSVSPGEVHICLSVLKYTTPYQRNRVGLCSSYLRQLKPDARVQVHVQKGAFKFPPISDPAPLILVGPGTGIAPFKSLVQERAAHWLDNRDANIIVYFGNRNKMQDFLYEGEWTALQSNPSTPLRALHCAWSRDQEHKIYVQHLMQRTEDVKAICSVILDQQGYIYIAGSADKMPLDVQQALIDALSSREEMSPEDAKQLLINMQRCGRFQMETWG